MTIALIIAAIVYLLIGAAFAYGASMGLPFDSRSIPTRIAWGAVWFVGWGALLPLSFFLRK